MKILFAIAVAILFIGCASPVSQFSLVANKVPEGIDRSSATTVSGSASTIYLWLSYPIPISANNETNLEAAVRDALSKAPGKNLLIDANISRYSIPYPPLFFVRGVEITGKAVRYEPEEKK